MAAEMAAEAALWADAERDYADLEIKVSAIAKRVGLSTIQLSLKAKRLGWPMRTAQARPKPEASKKSKTKTVAKKAALKPIVLVRRVYKTIDGELTKLEQQAGASSQDRERASRALSQMVSSLEKAVEMQREITKDTAKGSGSKNKEALAHAEGLRRAIAERIERLQRQRTPGKRSAASE